ncbi:antibiotic biosynthesis monooxygenase [Pullulanibacillus sp. KACC 23026]|uniref:antibiotic biosynthesis monooxygenase family protein n=1 Tax=Pullulanibacillus sp. KACC 23026 TaxID=3028315 RepID=UPI0023B1CD22|nr:antibiotic biosynthesis monooxygenase [Pullulanibacillus sp. KACC 23026]WEG13712.1 antibiotic biosynthesis monooxygenase [Pullulanibacillus sp. KACC 23026]
MFVTNACFEVDKAGEDRLKAKARKNEQDIQGASGLVSYECWRTDHKDTIEYVFVSKWEKQDHFKAWISRDAHVEEHKARRQRKKESGVEPQYPFKKTLRFYEVVEPDQTEQV